MALDTVKLKSPALTSAAVAAIERLHNSKRKMSVGTVHGEIEHHFVAVSLKGSYESAISLKVEHYERGNVDGKLVKTNCSPFLVVECSVHKVLAGHNIYGGPHDVAASIRWLIGFLSEAIGEALPPAEQWTIRKIDFAEVFQLPSGHAVSQWFEGLKLGDTYRKRTVHRYGNHGVQIGGHTTCLKFYHKGPEFALHDAKRLKTRMNSADLSVLQRMADTILRVEVSVKAQKLDYDFGNRPTVAAVNEEYLQRVYDKEIEAFLREGTSADERVRDRNGVKARLLERYGARLGRNLFATWMELAVAGEEAVRSGMRQQTFYEHIRYLREASCSWQGSDLNASWSDVPADFAPIRSDRRRIGTELPDVSAKLSPFKY